MRSKLMCLAALLGLVVLTTAAQEPNEGKHFTVSGSYTVDSGQVAVAVVGVPVTNRVSLLIVNAVAPQEGQDGLTFHSAEVEYARNLVDFVKARSSQMNPSLFSFAVSGGLGYVRRAQGEGNGSFAFTAAGRFTVRLNDTTSLDLVNYRYWRSRIATLAGPKSGDNQLASGIRISF